MNKSQADQLEKGIQKYKAWNKKASAKKVKLEKEITSIPVNRAFWRFGKGDWDFTDRSSFKLVFFSQTENHHQLVFLFPKLKSKYNSYSSHNPGELYFDFSNSEKIRSSLTSESIKSFLISAKKQAEIDAEFN